ncbi:MAG: putative hydro-lyase [Burkholderiales bacterium]
MRRGEVTGHTSGLAPGHVQGNVAILPQALAADFLHFCQLNPKPCPLLAMSAPGDPALPTLGEGIDMRSDVPRYRVFRKGELVEEPTDVKHLWRDDLVTFILGCSYSFEWALLEDGIRMRHMTEGKNVPMFRTSVQTVPAGPFHGPLVVSMRSFKPADAIRAVQITSRFPGVHGAPVHIGLPGQIGIKDVARPDWGDAVDVPPDELPLFWACGVTPQAVVAEVKPEFCITHAPGCMLVTDLKNSQLAVF